MQLTINTAANWRDYARENPAGKAAVDRSITTEGQPKSENTLIKVDVGPQTKLWKCDLGVMDDPSGVKGSPDQKDTSEIKASDLSAGRFVKVIYEEAKNHNQASSVIQLQPAESKRESQ